MKYYSINLTTPDGKAVIGAILTARNGDELPRVDDFINASNALPRGLLPAVYGIASVFDSVVGQPELAGVFEWEHNGFQYWVARVAPNN